MSEDTNIKSFSLSQLTMPLLILAVGTLLIWGVVSLLSTEKGYKKLVEELHSKTFGNRWVSAYELSKYMANNKIKPEDMDWFVTQLSGVYENNVDERTRKFIVMALGSVDHPKATMFLNSALEDKDEKIVFHALVGLANAKHPEQVDLNKISSFLKKDDPGIQQVAVMALAQHNHQASLEEIKKMSQHPNIYLRYTTLVSLIKMSELGYLSAVEPIFKDENGKLGNLDAQQVLNIKENILKAISYGGRKSPQVAIDFIEKHVLKDKNLKVSTLAQKVLIELKK